MTELMNVPDDLKKQYEMHKQWKQIQLSEPGFGKLGTVEGILRADACDYIERVGKLEDQNLELNDNLRQMTECRDDLTRLIAQRDSENAALRQQVERLSAPVTDAEETPIDFAIRMRDEETARKGAA